jgi:tRNA A37 threonylcarbamoyladenosine modification protein TsaB
MRLTLCIHTSAKSPWLYLLKNGLPFAEVMDDNRDPTTGPTLSQMAEGMLHDVGAVISDLTDMLVDIGPGRLSAVRAGVSFANALSFALKIPLTPVNASGTLGMQASMATGLPALVIHKSAAGAAYVGRYQGGELQSLRYGPLSEALAKSAEGLTQAALVGQEADVPGITFSDGGPDIITAATFAAVLAAVPTFTSAPIQPITEQSEVIDD